MQEHLVVYVTCKSREEAHNIAENLVEKHLVACGNIVPLIESVFFWEGNLQIEEEVLLILKTRQSAWEELEHEVRRLHSYDLPEIIALPIAMGSRDYLKWIDHEVTS